MTDNTIQPQEQRIESWKEIATYLKRDVRTVIRWEKTEGLPVHRQMHQARGNVFAYPSELEAWKVSRVLRLSAPPPITPWRRAVSAAAFAAAMMLSLVTLASGPILNPTIASAQGIVNRQVWSGQNVSTWGMTSNDGRFISATDYTTGDLAIHDLVTGGNRQLTHQGDWKEWAEGSVPSPDGKQVAYTWFSNMFELRAIGLDGSAPRTLVRDESIEYFKPYAWSPDGNQIFVVFLTKGKIAQIVSVSVADGSRKVLKVLGTSPSDWMNLPRLAVSPEGQYLAFDVSQSDNKFHHDIHTITADGSRETSLIEHPANDFPLAWSPDGKTLLFSSDRTGEPCIWAVEVMDGKLQGSPRILKSGVGNITAMGMGANGTFYYGISTGVSEIYTAAFDFETGKLLESPKPVTPLYTGRNISPAWSPDGKRLAFASVRRQAGMSADADTIVVRSLATQEESEIRPQLVTMRAYLGMSWSSDSNSLLVDGTDEKGADGYFQVDAQTGNVKPLLVGKAAEGVFRVAATPDSKVIAFTRNDPSVKFDTIRLRNLKTGEEREVVGDPSYGIIHGFAISPDGKQLAFTTVQESGNASVLRVMPLAGGTPREIFHLQFKDSYFWANGIAWTHDGRNIIFSRKNGDLVPSEVPFEKVSIGGGEPQKLKMTPMDWISGIRIHPDGRHVVFGAGRTSEEVWAMENFLPALRAAK